MSNVNLYIARKLGLTDIKKYKRYNSQVEIDQNWLYDYVLILAILIKHLHKRYDNQKMIKIIKFR